MFSHNKRGLTSIYEVAKFYFLENYDACADLEDCENISSQLLCELMRLQRK